MINQKLFFFSFTVLVAFGAAFAFAAGEEADFVTVSGCKQADYVAVTGDTKIGFKGFGYNPKCLTVPAGTTVTIDASGLHPLQGMDPIQGVVNPIFNATGGARAAVTVTLTQPGFYGYFCTNHGTATGEGMSGAILVQ